MYHKAREQALNNNRHYHVAAILFRRNKPIKIGVNVNKTHPKFKRYYSDGSSNSSMHAEMSVLRYAIPGDSLEVMRFRSCDKQLTMAKPCTHCMSFIKSIGIKKIRYTNWDGKWEEEDVD